jgi:steroid delta-isomerase-like uncharacterized protein
MVSEAIVQARLGQVERHVKLENLHDLDAVMDTFGDNASYDDEPWNEHHRGRDAVRSYYDGLLLAVPDLHIEVLSRHVAGDVVVLECEISGTHEGMWHGLPGTGRPIRIPLCGIYTFAGDGAEIAGERIYYDRATALEQVGVFHDPESTLGRLVTAVIHPVSMGRIAMRMARRDRSSARAT